MTKSSNSINSNTVEEVTNLPTTLQAQNTEMTIIETDIGDVFKIGDLEIPIINQFTEVRLVQPGSVKDHKELAPHTGKFLFVDLGESRETLNLIPMGIRKQGRDMYPPFGPGDRKKICWSHDGVLPARRVEIPQCNQCGVVKYPADFLNFQQAIITPSCPKSEWHAKEAPECSDYIIAAFFELEFQIPIQITFKGTGMSTWNAFKKSYQKTVNIAKIRRHRLSDYVLKATTINEGTYFKMDFNFTEDKDLNPGQYRQLWSWYRQNLLIPKEEVSEPAVSVAPDITIEEFIDAPVAEQASADGDFSM
jgi:hypothetical protein